MTEIPEHLLKRSKSAKSSKLGGGESDAGAPAAASAAPAAATAAAPAAPAMPPALAKAASAIPPDKPEPPVTPDPPYVAASKNRPKMPLWAMGLVAALPLWAYIYAGTMQQQEVADTLYVDAAALYSVNCSACHGASGDGAQGYQFSSGEIMATFSEPIDQMIHIARGSGAINGEQYGDPDRPGGARIAGARGAGVMPAFGTSLSVEELEAVTLHIRVVIGGEAVDTPEMMEWESGLRERLQAGSTPVDLDALLACGTPEVSPGATGDADPAACPGPPSSG